MISNIDLNETEEQIIRSVRDLKYGTVEIVIHDSKIVQVEKSEKIRFDKKVNN